MRIGELAESSGFSTKTIRYYEEIGLLPPPDREVNGYRSYGDGALQRLRFIQHAQAAGLTLREMGQVFAIRSEGRAPCLHVRELLTRHLLQIDRRIAELQATRRELQDLAARAETVDPAECPEDAICAIIVHPA